VAAAEAAVERAVAAFRRGEPVLVHDFDDREGETDLLYPADAVTPDAVARLRNDGGGLVFVAVPDAVAEAFDLPFLHDAIDHPTTEYDDVGYDSRPSFSLTVNHRDTYTGVTDDDRARTIVALGEAAREARSASEQASSAERSSADRSSGRSPREDGEAASNAAPDATDFAAEFRAPGHVHVLRAAPGLLGERQGHTELGLALADAADAVPAVAGCEMLDDDSGGALPTADARAYADRHGLAFVEGWDVVAALG
jgi:3,4-dihydroxy 2-butanone 4-phosphate synthase